MTHCVSGTAEFLADDWPETVGVSRPEVWKALFRKYPDLLPCLRRDVPTWAPAGMSKEETGGWAEPAFLQGP